MELYISELADGRLNLQEVFVIGGEEPSKLMPTMTGDIAQEPAFYQTIPVETFVSGDRMKDIPEKHELEHVVIVQVASQEPYRLDFNQTYAFNCAKQEFYRVNPIPLHEEKDLQNPVLRFLVDKNRFVLDAKEAVPDPILLNYKHEAESLGIMDFGVDGHVDAALAALPGPDQEQPEGEEVVGARAVAEQSVDPDEEPGDPLEGPDIDHYDTPDVPAVDLA